MPYADPEKAREAAREKARRYRERRDACPERRAAHLEKRRNKRRQQDPREAREINRRAYEKVKVHQKRIRDLSNRVFKDWHPKLYAWQQLTRVAGTQQRAPMCNQLTFWHIPWSDNCLACNKDLDWVNRTHCDGAHFDRIDSTRGYEVGNVQILCKQCNLNKSDRSPESWEHYMEDNYERFS